MTARDLRRLGCAALIGAAVALPAGMMVADRESPARLANGQAAGAAEGRKFYSPNIAGDPYVLDQQRNLVEALERQCRHYGERCAEAEQARRWMNRQERAD